MTAAVLAGCCVMASLLTVGCGSSGHNTAAPATTAAKHVNKVAAPRKCSSYTGAKRPQTCIPKSGSACDTYVYLSKPKGCFTLRQWRVRERVRIAKAARLAAYRKVQAERAAARERAREARAAARRAAIAAANAWHQGYNQQDGNVYWKWVHGSSCQDYATDGCWHVAVITRDGCSSYVAVNANEYSSGGQIVNALLDNQGYGIPAKTVRIFELDADPDGDTANNVTVDCQ